MSGLFLLTVVMSKVLDDSLDVTCWFEQKVVLGFIFIPACNHCRV
jgi:hypothetical protein